MSAPEHPHGPALARGLGFWEATAINITQIVGAGVFATIPLILGVLPAAYALLAWLVAGVLILADSMVWGELGAALPAAGGSYHFLLESYGRSRWGRLMAFLFVWQILISGPLEVGSGLVAAAQFSTAIDPDYRAFDVEHTRRFELEIADDQKIGFAFGPSRLFGFALGVLMIALLYRRITRALSLVFLIGVLGVSLGCCLKRDPIQPALAFDTSLTDEERPRSRPRAGVGMGFAIHCTSATTTPATLGGEVRNPGAPSRERFLTSALLVIVLFTLGSTCHYRRGAAARGGPGKRQPDASSCRVRGDWPRVRERLPVGSCFASAFSGPLGYSRVPLCRGAKGTSSAGSGAIHPSPDSAPPCLAHRARWCCSGASSTSRRSSRH